MDMRLFLLKREGEEIPIKQKIKVVSNLNSFSDNDVDFEEYTSLKELFGALSGALSQNDFIVIAVAGEIYNKTKLKLIKALSLSSAENTLVASRLKSLSLDEQSFARNAEFPEDAIIFPSDDGVNSGFAVEKGKQNIIVLPLDEQHTDAVIKKGLVPYITSGYVTPAPEEEKKEEETAEEAETEALPSAITDSEKQVALRTLNLLKESNIRIAVNGNANSEMLKKFAGDFDGFDEYFTFTPHIEDRGNYNVTDYTAQMARSAKGLSNAEYGACISDIFTNDEVDYICIAVATEKSALVRKLYKEENETDEEFTVGATEELFALISEKISDNGAVGIEIAQEEAPDKKAPMKKSSKIIIAIACVVIVAVLAIGTLFFLKYRKDKEPETTVPETTETTTAQPETTTEPPVVIAKMPLSELIRYEMVNGIQNKSNRKPETTESTTAGAIVADDETTTEPAAPEIPSAGAPTKITVNGVEMDARQAIASIVAVEIDGEAPTNAIKAHAVVVYTYLKYRDTDWKIDNVEIREDYSENILDAVNDVFGEYLRYEDQVAFTPFHKLSAGKTSTSEIVFGKPYDYLISVPIKKDTQRDGYNFSKTVTAEEMAKAIKAYDSSITLDEDKSQWIGDIKHDGAVDSSTGYVSKMRVGNREDVSGITFIYDILADEEIDSVCFSIKYNEENETFTITTYGKGYGVGMSLLGAEYYANIKRKYDKILDTFYPGTILEKDETAPEITTAPANDETTTGSQSSDETSTTAEVVSETTTKRS